MKSDEMAKQNKGWKLSLGLALFALLLFGLAGCSNNGVLNPSGSGSAFVFIGDEPPLNSTILKFEIDLVSADLCPQVGSAGQCLSTAQLSQVSLISQEVEIELKQLELESAFLSLISVPAGTYEGVKLTFANPELKVMLNDGTVQELEAPADFVFSETMVTPTFEGGSLSVSANINFGFLIDFNFRDSIQSSGDNIVEVSPMVKLVKLPSIAQQKIEELDDVVGQPAAAPAVSCTPPSGTFDLIDSATGVVIPGIRVDGDTDFKDFNCDDFVANQTNQIVEVDAELRAGATLESAEFVADDIEFVNPPDEDDVEGIVFEVNNNSQFVLLVQETREIPNVGIGHFLTVTLTGGTEFRIDQDDLAIPGNLGFDNGDDVIVGQRVEVDVVNGTLVTIPFGCSFIGVCSATAEKLKLKQGSLTASVASVDVPNLTFTLEDLPSIFGSTSDTRPIIASCQDCFFDTALVRTSAQTEFRETVASVGDLSSMDIVTVRGLLFKNGFDGPSPGMGVPELIARRVRRRAP